MSWKTTEDDIDTKEDDIAGGHSQLAPDLARTVAKWMSCIQGLVPHSREIVTQTHQLPTGRLFVKERRGLKGPSVPSVFEKMPLKCCKAATWFCPESNKRQMFRNKQQFYFFLSSSGTKLHRQTDKRPSETTLSSHFKLHTH